MAKKIKDCCECEHIKHTGDEVTGHEYAKRFEPSELYRVKTIFGFFTICKDCRENCIANYIIDWIE